MPTRGEVEELLSSYAGNGNDFATRLDLVRSELLPMGNWRGSKVAILLSIYTDVDGWSIVTLPRTFNTILAGLANPPSNVVSPFCRWPLLVRNGWWETLPYSRGLSQCCNRGSFNEVNGRFCTFSDWTTPLQLRFKFETTEASGKLTIQGTNNGTDVYSGTPWAKGEILAFSGITTVTTTNSFDARNLYIVKPETKGRVSMYTWDGATETLVAVYDPGETVPRWRRYHVPTITNPTTSQFLAICKIAFIKLISDTDEVVPGNIGALRRGLEALKLEDSHDYVRAAQEWENAKSRLIDEREDDEGAGATGHIRVEDTFNVGGLNAEWGWGDCGEYYG